MEKDHAFSATVPCLAQIGNLGICLDESKHEITFHEFLSSDEWTKFQNSHLPELKAKKEESEADDSNSDFEDNFERAQQEHEEQFNQNNPYLAPEEDPWEEYNDYSSREVQQIDLGEDEDVEINKEGDDAAPEKTDNSNENEENGLQKPSDSSDVIIEDEEQVSEEPLPTKPSLLAGNNANTEETKEKEPQEKESSEAETTSKTVQADSVQTESIEQETKASESPEKKEEPSPEEEKKEEKKPVLVASSVQTEAQEDSSAGEAPQVTVSRGQINTDNNA